MGRKRQPDRAWARFNKGLGRWEIVTVRGGRRNCSLCPPGTSEAGATRAAEIIAAELGAGTLVAPDVWGDVDEEDSAVGMFLTAAKRGEHKARPKRGRIKALRPNTLTWYGDRLRAAGRILARLKGKDFDPLALSARDGADYVALRRQDTNRAGEPISDTTINDELEAVTILQRWLVLRKWVEHATWDDVARLDAVSSSEPLNPDEAARFLRAAKKLARAPRETTDWFAAKEARAANQPRPRPSERRIEDWDQWLLAVWLFMHGFRTGELVNLRIRDLDPDAGCVWIVDRSDARTKTSGSAGFVPIMAREAIAEMRRVKAGRAPDGRAFHTGNGVAAVATGRTKWFLYRCHETCRIAGIRRCSDHELRHTVAAAALAAGVELSSVRALLRHESEKTTRRRYGHIEDGRLAIAAARTIGTWLDGLASDRDAG